MKSSSSFNRRSFIKTTAMGSMGIGMVSPLGNLYGGVTSEKRIGIIGMDTSHCVAFTKYIHSLNSGFKVVAAFTTVAKDIPSCYNRVDKFKAELKGMGVEIMNSVAQVLKRSDYILLETADGRVKLDQATEIFKSGKRVFIDKPVAASFNDVAAIYQAAKKYGAVTFSSSGTRFLTKAQAVRNGEIGQVLGADTFSPVSYEPTHSDLFWYGIHGVELLFTVMGTGCVKVRRVQTEKYDHVTGIWNDGRMGTFRGILEGKGKRGYGGQAFGTKEISYLGGWEGYEPLVDRILTYFETGQIPVQPAETMEIYGFMEAARRSSEQGGDWFDLQTLFNEVGYKG
jgi:predicted dehydrogenase